MITTRDKHLLVKFGVKDSMFRIDPLYSDDALQLFSRYAFKAESPDEDFKLEAQSVVKYAGGNPLALKVLGSFLFRKSIEDWESALRKLRKIANPDIHNLLRISFDGLDKEEQNIFLDIACFFKRKRRDYVIKILDGSYHSAEYGIGALVDKSLISITKYKKIHMHDLIQEMGWEIVREKSFDQGGIRSRLHNPEDASLLLKRKLVSVMQF